MHRQFEESSKDKTIELQVQTILDAIDGELNKKRDDMKNIKLLEGQLELLSENNQVLLEKMEAQERGDGGLSRQSIAL